MDNNLIVQVQQGKLCGIRETNIRKNGCFYAFRGIPFAKSPVGDLRFKDPEPVEPWSGVKDAKDHGSVCAQFDWRTKQIIGSDDCLYLNVYTRELTPTAPRSVMVWIHGGGFVGGSGNDDVYGPDFLVDKDVVLVTINYRLGILGFLNLDDEDAPGNQGLKDQVMALKWVQQNIEKFGGDRTNVTIFGESAGGAAVHYLTLSPLAQGLFHKAIMQSGVATNPWAYTSSPMKNQAQKIADKFGKNITDTKELIAFFKTINAIDLVQADLFFQTWQDRFLITNTFVPSVDSKSKHPFLNFPLNEAVKSGIKVPVIFGHTSHEGIILLHGLKEENYGEIDDNEEMLLHPNIKKFLQERNVSVDDLKKFFMGDKKISCENVNEFVDLISATNFVLNIHHIFETQPQIPGIPTYAYKFEYYSPERSMMQKIFGVDVEGTSHGEELFYFFYPKMFGILGIEPFAPGSTEYEIQQRFLELWTTFAKTGNPNPKTSELVSIEWEPIDNSTEFKCLKISKDLCLIKNTNLVHRLIKNIKNKL